MAHQIIPETIDGKWTGRMLHLNENGEQVDPVTESVVQGTDAVMLKVEAPAPVAEVAPEPAPEPAPVVAEPVALEVSDVPADVPVTEPAAPEVAPASEEG